MTKSEFKQCFDQWFDPLRNFIHYRCGDTEIATDVAQEAFMKMWEKNIEYHPHKTKGLLYKIAKELWISQHRKLDSARKYELSLTVQEEEQTPEKTLEFKELKQKYEAALTKLPPKQRTTFLMSRMENLSYKEIAERLDISVKAVEKRMTLALQSLRKTLAHGKYA